MIKTPNGAAVLDAYKLRHRLVHGVEACSESMRSDA